MFHSLSRKLILANALLVLGVTSAIVVCIFGVLSLRDAALHSVHEYEELRMIDAAQRHLMNARFAALRGARTDRVLELLDNAIADLSSFQSFQRDEDEAEQEHQDRERSLEHTARSKVLALRTALSQTEPDAGTSDVSLPETLEAAIRDLNRLAEETEVESIEQIATARASAAVTLIIVALAMLLVFALALTLGVYRIVMDPLRELRQGTRELAAGHFETRLSENRDAELADLAGDFNRMAEQLQTFYGTLEEQVRTRSRELVQSERLASVGFLAAGLAHEISTPLNVITGYAELSMRSGRNDTSSTSNDDIEDALRIIREEAYRCKEIIQQLLTLARRTDKSKKPVDVAAVTSDVIAMLSGMKQYSDRELILLKTGDGPFLVMGNEVELKQVLLNLVINALHAVSAGSGRIEVSVSHDNGLVKIAVRDNGCGMSGDTLAHVFEPFFTVRGRGMPNGIGLGLSVSHAIITDHGGRIVATSPGPGQGSSFTMELKATDANRSEAHRVVASDGA